MSNINRYYLPKINSIEDLSKTLSLSIKNLVEVGKNSGHMYHPFDIRKKNSKKWRHIDHPSEELKKIQKKINSRILADVQVQTPENIVGGIKNRNLLDNALPHINQEMVLSLDIKNCFPNTSSTTVYDLWKSFFCFRNEVPRILTQLTTRNRHLPQGSPTSLSIANLILLDAFEDVNSYCKLNNLQFTLFVDDITISGKSELVLESIDPIIKCMQKHGHKISGKKIHLMPSNVPQIVTGIQVNNGLSINKSNIDSIRKELIEIKSGYAPIKQSVSTIGKIEYISFVSPKKGLKLHKFAKLIMPRYPLFQDQVVKKGDVRQSCNGKFCKAVNN